ncbi:hypothetical protein CQA01_37060 [Cyclobacterium qasimii]|nr:hypothetical protein CQA01_37060 [Cyclobacterium qasimii]
MFRLLKIFGFTSLGLVLILSFFDGHRANNSGEDPTFTTKDAGLLFFYNVRRIDYQIKRLPEAKIEIYTNTSFDRDSTKNTLQLDLILNKNKQTAFLYLKPLGKFTDLKTLRLRNGQLPFQDSLILRSGAADRHLHLAAAKKIAGWLQKKEAILEVYTDEKWLNLYSEKKQKEAFIDTLNDFLKITANK